MKQSLEFLYKQLMDKAAELPKSFGQAPDEERFKSVLHPDYSDYSTSTVTGSIS